MSRCYSIVLAILLSCAALAVFSPAQARFLQVDPVGYKDDVDLYTYVHNDPTDRVDPSGQDDSPYGMAMNNARIEEYERADPQGAATTRAAIGGFVLDTLPITGEYRAAEAYDKNPSVLNGAIIGLSLVDLGGVAKVTKDIALLEKGAASLERNAAAHEAKAAAFAANPTVKSEMAGMSKEAIAKQQAA